MLDRLYTVLAVAATFGCLIFRPAYSAVRPACAYAITGRHGRVALTFTQAQLEAATA